MQSEEDERALEKLRLRYQRVQESLEDEITRGGRPPGSRLPPERALAEHFGVSRVTLRRALAELERSGVVARADAGGWAVAGRRLGEPPNALMSFSEMAAARGLTASAHVTARSVRPATLDEADVLGLAPGADLFELERLRLMDDVPILLDHTLIPLSLVPGLERVDFDGVSLYGVLEERYGIRPTTARFSVEAIAADPREAQALGLEPGEPLLSCQQLTQDQTGRLIELCQMHYRGDRYRFRATLVRGSDEGPAPTED